MSDPAGPLAELRRANAELVAARRAALNLMEDAILARDALKASEERQAFLLRLSDALRPLADPGEVLATACRLVGEYLGANRAYYVEVDEATGLSRVPQCYTRGDSLSLVGVYRVADFGWVIPHMRLGELLVIPDVTDSPLVPAADRPALAAVGIAAHITAPLVKDGVLVGALCVTEPRPRQWTRAEAVLVRETAERVWAAVERSRAVDALRASEERLRAVAANLPRGAVFVVDRDLRYTLAAGEALAAAGYSATAVEGRTVAEVLPPALADRHAANFRRALAGETFRTEDAAHGRFYVTHGVPLRDAAGEMTAALAVSYDITDRVTAETALQATEAQYRLLVENVRDHAIFAMTPDGTVVTWNDGAERVFGWTAAEMIGRSGDVLFTPEDRAAGLPEKERATAATTGRATDENWAVRADGSRFWASGSSSAVRDAAGALTGFVKVVRDRTEARAAAEALRESRGRLRLALAAARMGIWRWDIAADVHMRDANLNRLLGRPAEETRSPLAGFLAAIHPDDRAAVADAFDRSVRHGHNLSVEFRVVWPDGSVHWLRDQGDVFGGADGRYLTGACVDVTELKQTEAELRQTRDELEERVRDRTQQLAEVVAELRTEAAEREQAEADRRELAARLTTAQEEERTRIARELHDRLGQHLAGLSLGLNAARETAADPAVRGRLDRLLELTAEAGREVHRLATELRPTALDDTGLETAVQAHVERWAAETGIAAEFGGRGLDGERVPEPAATTVYRAVQEALTNVVKHAGAKRVSVLLDRRPDGLEAIIEDDGRGFDPDAPPAGGRRGLGLLGMRERIGLAGGTLEVESAPGVGTTLYVRVPLPTTDPP